MSEQILSAKPKRITQKIVAAAAVFALAPLAGCSASQEQLAMQETTRQVFADALAGKTVSTSSFGDNTFTISVKDKYPDADMTDAEEREVTAFYTYEEGEKRMNTALNLGQELTRAEYELQAQAACGTAAVNNMLTPVDLGEVRDKWDYYQQLGGTKELEKSSAFDSIFSTIIDLDITCSQAVRHGLESGADVTFVPAMND